MGEKKEEERDEGKKNLALRFYFVNSPTTQPVLIQNPEWGFGSWCAGGCWITLAISGNTGRAQVTITCSTQIWMIAFLIRILTYVTVLGCLSVHRWHTYRGWWVFTRVKLKAILLPTYHLLFALDKFCSWIRTPTDSIFSDEIFLQHSGQTDFASLQIGDGNSETLNTPPPPSSSGLCMFLLSSCTCFWALLAARIPCSTFTMFFCSAQEEVKCSLFCLNYFLSAAAQQMRKLNLPINHRTWVLTTGIDLNYFCFAAAQEWK